MGVTLITYYLLNPVSCESLNQYSFIYFWLGRYLVPRSLLNLLGSLSIWLAIFERIPLQFDFKGDLIIVTLVSGFYWELV